MNSMPTLTQDMFLTPAPSRYDRRWIPWSGSADEIPPRGKVAIKFKDQQGPARSLVMGLIFGCRPASAYDWSWREKSYGQIVAYIPVN